MDMYDRRASEVPVDVTRSDLPVSRSPRAVGPTAGPLLGTGGTTKRPVAESSHEPVEIPLPEADMSPPARRDRTLRMAVLCVLLAVGAAAVLIPAIRSVTGNGDRTPGAVLGGVLLDGGLPPVGDAEAESDSAAPSEDTDPLESVTDPVTDPPETVPVVLIPPESETDPTDPAGTESESAEPVPPSETETVESGSAETVPPETVPEETDPPETEPAETEPSRPAGAFPIVSADLSAPDKSVGYIQSTADRLPPSIPGEDARLWSTEDAPAVLIVHTHPYEGYHDGPDWYDPASGSLAQTNAPNDPDGVVALGAGLTRRLREAGVTVIHLRVPVAVGESAAETYARTEEAVRYYCELYSDIGLVLDLRRSAELTEAGEILRTLGQYEGKETAQVRLSVNADRPTEAVSRDIAVAVRLREALWAEEPTVSRPVWVKSGSGLVGDLDRAVFLTLELGSAGNRFSEAERLLDPLAAAIAALVQKT